MGLRNSNTVPRALLAALLCAAIPQAAAPPSRIRAEIQNGRTFVLKGNVHPSLASAEDLGEAPETLALPGIAIHFQMTAAQQADLDRLLEEQQNPASPQFHKWLTPEEYADRFGLSEADAARIVAWLERMGFSDVQVARGRSVATMSGTAAVVRYAFGTPIHRYRVKGVVHYANAAEPSFPAELEGMITGVRGLHDFHPRARTRPRPRFTSSISGGHFLAPGDFATIYDLQRLYNSGINGTGVSVAISGQTDITISAIEAFQSASGLPTKAPQVKLTGPDPGSDSGDLGEADLDIEWAGAVARGATIIFVNSEDAFTSATYAVTNTVAPVISITYGLCEQQMTSGQINGMNNVFQQANAQGQTIVAAAGDVGAADCDDGATVPSVATQGLAVDFPGSSPYVTCMGGTEFNEGSGTYWSSSNGANSGSAIEYIPEIGWNDTLSAANAVYGYPLDATGGGASTVFPKPSWQVGAGVPRDGQRDVPDVSFDASDLHDPYLTCDPFDSDPNNENPPGCTNGYRDSEDYLNPVGGTSAATPTFAGVVALIIQKTGSWQGNVNPRLYALAASAPSAFHDITSGNNQVPCQIGTPNCITGTMGYLAGPGYDQVTGLGTPDVYNLVTEWPSAAPTPTPTPTPAPTAPVLSSPGNGATGVAVAPTLNWQASSGATSYNVLFGTASPPPQVTQTASTSYSPGTLNAGTTYYWQITAVNSGGSSSSAIWSFTTAPVVPPSTSLLFVPVAGCRIADTRQVQGTFGGPTMTGGSTRTFPIPESACGIPASALAYSLNVTVVPQGPLGYLTLWPAGQSQPYVSTLNSFNGIVVANAAIVPAGTNGGVSVFVYDTTDVILDIDGYFTSGSGAAFYAATPCRIADTRSANGPLGGPSLTTDQTRSFPMLSAPCGLPASATAYSMNVTAVPDGPLGYMTAFATGQPLPTVSTLNSDTGKVVANAALVPAGTNGAISIFVTNPSDVVLDNNGYFAAPGGTGALSFYPVTPCRIVDTRNANGNFGGPALTAGGTRSFVVPSSGCSIPSTAQAYSLNVTVVPLGPMLSYLTLWPAGSGQPFVSTLNSWDGSVVANAAIVPAGIAGAVSVYATDATQVILDINGYFAP